MADRRFPSGISWSLLSAFLWATTFVCARHLLGGGQTDPLSLAMIRFVIGGSVLMGYALVTAPRRVLGVGARDHLQLAVLGLSGIVGMSVLLFVGQLTTTAINSSLIMQSNPIMIALLGTLIGERLGLRGGAGVLLGLAGCLLVVGVIQPSGGIAYDTRRLGGDLCVALAALCWAVYSVAGKRVVERLGGLVSAAWAMGYGAVELVVIWAAMALTHPSGIHWPAGRAPWAMIVYLSIFPTAIAFLAWYKAMNRIPLALLNVMQYLTPMFTILLAWLLLGERMTWTAAAGMGLILGGVMLTAGDR